MKQNDILLDKSFDFAKRTVFFSRELNKNGDYVLSKQFLRSGTAIGALAEESVGAQSAKDFLNKVSIAYKEARETKYWLRLIKETTPIWLRVTESLLADVEELLRIIGSIQTTTKRKLNGL